MTQTVSATDEQIAAYQRDGFVRIPDVLSTADAARFAAAARAARDRRIDQGSPDPAFTQVMQAWQQDDTLRELTLSPVLASIATALAGIPLRLYHDQLLVKEPHNGVPTAFHQDQPYYPHLGCRHALSAWIALVDVPVERGCMTFISGSHHLGGQYRQNIHDSDNLLTLAPELMWKPRVTLPLRAGDCTFHHSLTAHSASPNLTDEARLAHVVVYMDVNTRFDPRRRRVGEPLEDQADDIAGVAFPDNEYPPLP
jgi:ectoine hydroxylase-related dioxygenase (phytanoyl-CoA dioxygenase family)